MMKHLKIKATFIKRSIKQGVRNVYVKGEMGPMGFIRNRYKIT